MGQAQPNVESRERPKRRRQGLELPRAGLRARCLGERCRLKLALLVCADRRSGHDALASRPRSSVGWHLTIESVLHLRQRDQIENFHPVRRAPSLLLTRPHLGASHPSPGGLRPHDGSGPYAVHDVRRQDQPNVESRERPNRLHRALKPLKAGLRARLPNRVLSAKGGRTGVR
jgi:hypothetical protein